MAHTILRRLFSAVRATRRRTAPSRKGPGRTRTTEARRPRHRAGPLFLSLLLGTVAVGGCDGARPLLVGATTTLEDSGMLDTLSAAFEAAHAGHRVAVTTSGSGAILEMARRGDLGVVVTHLPHEERRLVDEGALADRTPVMHNHFLIAGPAADPAGVRAAADPVEAFRRIAAAGAPFVSRGDGSGTHARERALWHEAGLDPAPEDRWYTEAGVGMGQTLMLAGERRAYTLVDPATFAVLGDAAELRRLSSPHPALLNVYSVMIPTGNGQSEAARRFVEWLAGPDARAVIERFGVETYGAPLYIPGEPDPGL